MKMDLSLPSTTHSALVLMGFISIGLAPVCQAGTVSGDYTVNSFQLNEPPSASNHDLVQTHYGGRSATGGNGVSSQHAELFNGLVGNDDDDTNDSGEVAVTPDIQE